MGAVCDAFVVVVAPDSRDDAAEEKREFGAGLGNLMGGYLDKMV